jgi:hypothetical protein
MYFEDIELGYKSWGEGRCKGKGLAKVGVKCFFKYNFREANSEWKLTVSAIWKYFVFGLH